MRVEFTLSFEDYVEQRSERRPGAGNSTRRIIVAGVAALGAASLLFGLTSGTAGPPVEGVSVVALLLLLAAFLWGGRYFRRRSLARETAALRSDYERFCSSRRVFEANDRIWKYLDSGEQRIHMWSELSLIVDQPRTLLLGTDSGWYVLAKSAFTQEQLALLKQWCDRALGSNDARDTEAQPPTALVQ